VREREGPAPKTFRPRTAPGAAACCAVSATHVLLQKLQITQNAAARMTTGTSKFDHITPVLYANFARPPT